MKNTFIWVLFLVSFPLFGQEFEYERSLMGTGGVQNLRFSPDGKLLATAGLDGYVTLWETHTGKIVRRMEAHTGAAYEVTFSKDGSLLASAGQDAMANVWEVRTGKRLGTYNSKPYVDRTGRVFNSASFVVFSPNNKHIYYGGDNGHIMKAEVGSSKAAEFIFSTNYDDGRWYSTITGGTISSDEKYLVYTVGRLIQFLDLKTNTLAKYIRHDSDFNDVVNSPFENSIATWSYDGKVTFWNNNTTQKISAYQVTEPENYGAASFSKDGRYMVTGASGTLAKIWDLSNGKLMQVLKGHDRIVRLGRFSPADNVIATASYDGSVRIWKIPEMVAVVEPKVIRDTVVIKETVVIHDTVLVDRPEEGKVVFENQVIKVGESINLKNVQFEQGSYILQKTAFPELQKLIDLMNKHPKIEIEVAGHTDNVGLPEKNYALSERRVQTVKNYLIDKGIPEYRIKTVAFGGSKPIADNRYEHTRKLNRRVEMRILKM